MSTLCKSNTNNNEAENQGEEEEEERKKKKGRKEIERIFNNEGDRSFKLIMKLALA